MQDTKTQNQENYAIIGFSKVKMERLINTVIERSSSMETFDSLEDLAYSDIFRRKAEVGGVITSKGSSCTSCYVESHIAERFFRNENSPAKCSCGIYNIDIYMKKMTKARLNEIVSFYKIVYPSYFEAITDRKYRIVRICSNRAIETVDSVKKTTISFEVVEFSQ